jgi:hypothetical protein
MTADDMIDPGIDEAFPEGHALVHVPPKRARHDPLPPGRCSAIERQQSPLRGRSRVRHPARQGSRDGAAGARLAGRLRPLAPRADLIGRRRPTQSLAPLRRGFFCACAAAMRLRRGNAPAPRQCAASPGPAPVRFSLQDCLMETFGYPV